MAITTYEAGVAPAESFVSAVNWGPIIAGAFAASTLTFTLVLLGSGIGLTLVSPWSGEGAGITAIAVSTAIWLVVVQWLSAGVGGYLTGRLRTRWANIHGDETFFRDTAHGFMAWALSTLLLAFVLGSALTAAAGVGVNAAATVASGMAADPDDNAGNASLYFVDAMFRPADPALLATPDTAANAAAAAQASRILLASAGSGEVTADDRVWLTQLVAARAGLSEAAASQRVDEVLARAQQANVDARAAADAARKAGATFALTAALSLMVGAFIASVAAAIGGRQRDEDEARFLTMRG